MLAAKQIISPRSALAVRFWGGEGARGGDDFLKPLSNIIYVITKLQIEHWDQNSNVVPGYPQSNPTG